jgi:hypothetical protein
MDGYLDEGWVRVKKLHSINRYLSKFLTLIYEYALIVFN